VFILVGTLQGQTIRKTLVLNQTRYAVTAGDRVRIEVPAETLQFARTAKTHVAKASGRIIRDFAIGPSVEGDAILLGVPLTTQPGEYTVEISFSDDNGEDRSATLQVTVEPFAVPATVAGVPPVVLLDGFQASLTSSCPMSRNSSGTFGNLQSYLSGAPNNIPNVYFFENCTECPNCSIEQLGADLGTFLNTLSVPQVDVVAHSMGGLIIRSYLSGKQTTSGVFSPPAVQKIRKAVFVATPHFGSFQADSQLADILFAAGVQDNSMKRGSQFLWDLGTWNQFGDDLRGVDALAVVGNAGPSQQSDGVVYSTSASLDFAIRGRTRVVGYCHIPPDSFDGLASSYLNCNQPGIAFVNSPSHLTYQIVSSFLMNGAGWESVGIAPAQEPNLSLYGGLIVADVNASDLYITPSSASFGTVKLASGAASELFYADFSSGTGSFSFGSSICGPYTETASVYSTVRCKSPPSISSIGPLLIGTGRVVQAGGTITISGVGFGSQQCSTCKVTAASPTPTSLQVSSWSDTTITANLPASYGIGVATIGVTAASGLDAMNIVAGTVSQPPVISLSTSSLNFSYTMGGPIPPSQAVTVNNSGGDTLSYAVSSNAAWLVAAASGNTITVSLNPAGLAANNYQGVITVTAAGASNSPQPISVSLVVKAATGPTLTIASITNSATNLQGTLAPGELFTIKGTNLGPTTGVSFSLNGTGMVNTTLAGTGVTVGSFAAPILYTSATQVNAIVPYEVAGQSQLNVVVQYQGSGATESVEVLSASPGAFTVDETGSGQVAAMNQGGTINGPSQPAAKGSIVTVYWTGGGQTNPPGVTGSVVGDILKWLAQPISVTVGNQAAIVTFDGSAPTLVDGVDQLNIQLSPNTPSGTQPVVITVGGISSPSAGTITVQ
jgi:uncharacterized protein (TIGR03437 family)